MASKIVAKGYKKTSGAVCECTKADDHEIRINKVPLSIYPDMLMQSKLQEVVNVIGLQSLKGLDFNIVLNKDCGFTGRVYAARQTFCRAVLAYFGTYAEEYKKQEIQKRLMAFDRFTVIKDTRVKEPKKYNGPGARARYQKSYR